MYKYIYLSILFFICGESNLVFAQSHRVTPPTNCKFAKVQATSNFIPCEACSKNDEKENDFKEELKEKKEYERTKIGALAIDRSNGFYFGFSYDYSTQSEAESRAIDECEKKGGNCTVVLVFQGEACAAYRTVATNEGTAYGWGVASTKEEADKIAYRECLRRSNGAIPQNFVWSCNSKSAEPAKTIYEAGDALPSAKKISNLITTDVAQLSADGQYLTIRGKDAIQIYEVPTLRLVFDETYESLDGNRGSYRVLHSATLSPDLKYLYVTESTGIFKVDLKTKKTVKKLPIEISGSKVKVSNDGKKLAISTTWTNKYSLIVDAENLNILSQFRNTHNGFNQVDISPDNKYAAFSAVMGYVLFVNLETGREMHKVQIGGNVQGGKFSADSKKFVIATFGEAEHPNPTADYTRVIEVSSGRVLKKFIKLDGLGKNAAFLDNDKKVIECNFGNDCNIRDYESGRKLDNIDVNNNWTINVTKSGKTFVTTGTAGIKVYVMDAAGKFRLKKHLKPD